MFEATGGCTLTRHWACGMITVSENITPVTME